MRWRAASTSARSGTGDAVMARVYHEPPHAMSQPAMGRTVPALHADHAISGDHKQSPAPRLAQAHTAAVMAPDPPVGAGQWWRTETADMCRNFGLDRPQLASGCTAAG